jgi:uncharacterized repeat protein (TIGR03803 family)
MIVTVVLIVTLLLAPGAWAASKYKTLYKFKAGKDGSRPSAGVIFDQAGNLYGTTYRGGTYDRGTAFRLAPDGNGGWKESVLHSFKAKDGWRPTSASLIFDSTGSLYGTTVYGGDHKIGTVFQLSPNGDGSWTESVLHSFDYTDPAGAYPTNGSLVFDWSGNLFGTTSYSSDSCGTVFQLTPNGDGSWTEHVLHTFSGADGACPQGGLIFDALGNLYGTTSNGGGGNCDFGCGTVFRLTPNGDGSWTESVLHSFNDDGKDGTDPRGGLTFDPAGNLYGTTGHGGGSGSCDFGCGTVFQLIPNGDGSWTESVLHSFNFDGRDGYWPPAGLVLDPAGNLYGTTQQGGAYGDYGTVFKLKPTAKGGWKETVLHSFKNQLGAYPSSGLILDGHGNLYGTTVGDHSTTFGSVFEITP